MLPPLKNLKIYFSLEESAILHLIEKEVIQQPTKCPNCHNSRISWRKLRWRCTNKKCRKDGPCLMKLFLIALAYQ
ncbi:hypothetical protein HZS_1273 [Henneguya salminicola]|nr:hypothetical protein HZS_1273 [Henneguya salminicola]